MYLLLSQCVCLFFSLFLNVCLSFTLLISLSNSLFECYHQSPSMSLSFSPWLSAVRSLCVCSTLCVLPSVSLSLSLSVCLSLSLFMFLALSVTPWPHCFSYTLLYNHSIVFHSFLSNLFICVHSNLRIYVVITFDIHLAGRTKPHTLDWPYKTTHNLTGCTKTTYTWLAVQKLSRTQQNDLELI